MRQGEEKSPIAAAMHAIVPPDGPTSRRSASALAQAHGVMLASHRRRAVPSTDTSCPMRKYDVATRHPRRYSRYAMPAKARIIGT